MEPCKSVEEKMSLQKEISRAMSLISEINSFLGIERVDDECPKRSNIIASLMDDMEIINNHLKAIIEEIITLK